VLNILLKHFRRFRIQNCLFNKKNQHGEAKRDSKIDQGSSDASQKWSSFERKSIHNNFGIKIGETLLH
jgi:hypothetical protein